MLMVLEPGADSTDYDFAAQVDLKIFFKKNTDICILYTLYYIYIYIRYMIDIYVI